MQIHQKFLSAVILSIILSSCGPRIQLYSAPPPVADSSKPLENIELVLARQAEADLAKKKADQNFVAEETSMKVKGFEWVRSGGGDFSFVVDYSRNGFQVTTIRHHYKAVREIFNITRENAPDLFKHLFRLFTGEIDLLAQPDGSGSYSGTWVVATLSLRDGQKSYFNSPYFQDENDTRFLSELEHYVAEQLTRLPAEAAQMKLPGCQELGRASLEGTWVEKPPALGCSGPTTDSSFHFKGIDAAGVEIYEGVDIDHSGGIKLYEPVVTRSIQYRFDLKKCVLERVKNGLSHTSFIAWTKGNPSGTYLPKQLGIISCDDLACSAMDSKKNGVPEKRILIRSEDSVSAGKAL